MSAVTKKKLYCDLYSAYSKAHSEKKSKQIIQDNVNNIWNNIKKNPDLNNIIAKEIEDLNRIVSKRQVSVATFWNKVNDRKHTENNSTIASAPSVSKENFKAPVVPLDSTSDEVKANAKRSTPIQENLRTECMVLLSDIEALEKRKQLDLLSDDMTKELRLKKSRLHQCQKNI